MESKAAWELARNQGMFGVLKNAQMTDQGCADESSEVFDKVTW